MASRLGVVLVVFALAVVAALTATRIFGPLDRPGTGDGPFFVALGRAMASGKGYVDERGPWPNQPNLERSPLWPAILAVPLALFPDASDFRVLRLTTALMHGICAVLLMMFAARVWDNARAAVLAGVLFALYPPALSLVDAGYSEHAWLAVFLGGLLLYWDNPVPGQAAGAALMGLSVLSRSNFLLFPAFVAICGGAWRRLDWKTQFPRFAILSLVFVLPACLWIIRNYRVSGAFPLLNGLEGETLHGANNEVTAAWGKNWGYWVFPDNIPGETPKRVLAGEMSGWALNKYYHQRAVSFLQSNITLLPWMFLGKLARGFVPIPWTVNKIAYIASLPRFLLYVMVMWVLRRQGFRAADNINILLASVFGLVLVTTLIFYGTYRFTFCLEPFLIVYVSPAATALWRDMKIAL